MSQPCSNTFFTITSLHSFTFFMKCFLLLVYIGSHHWICTCNFLHYNVQVMDSMALFAPMTLDTIILQISKIFSCSSKSALRVEVLSVQQQVGALDCGLYAIANAVEARLQTDVVYDQQKLRDYLLQCLRNRKFVRFPQFSGTEPLPRPTCTVRKIKLYCVCRMPKEFDERMICCDTCDEWYHYCCVQLSVLDNPELWNCSVCCAREC